MEDEKEVPAVEETVEVETTEDETTEQEVESEDIETEGPVSAPEGDETTKGRASARIQTLAAERKAERERADKAEREMSYLKAQMEAVQRQIHTGSIQKDAVAEAELLAQMDPIQRVQYEADKKIDDLKSEFQRLQLSSTDNQDKATFLSKAQLDPVRAKYADKVEQTLSEMRAKGLNAPRDDLYYYLLGKAMAEQKANGKSPERKAAQTRVETTQGRSSSIRSDAIGGGRGKTAEERLTDVIL